MVARDRLAEYHRRRDFSKTPEPEGATGGQMAERPSYVVQIHDATAMHFDFRLEVEGVLKSWAVPKGPSTDPHDKRLAMPTEDHPLEYRDFEGVIAGGEYGAGVVIVWDEGTYRNLSTDRAGREIPLAQAWPTGTPRSGWTAATSCTAAGRSHGSVKQRPGSGRPGCW